MGALGHASFAPETGLFTAMALTSGYGPDNHEAAVAAGLLADEEEGTGLTVLGDSAYGTGDLRAQLQADGHTLVIKPPPVRQAVPGGFTIDDFHIDQAAGTTICPAGPSRPQPPPTDQPRTHPHRRHLAPHPGHRIAKRGRPAHGRTAPQQDF
ncbi:transposase [Streptomyces albiflaviniger]|nr:transposase [Streptomyces albiflaviniger]